MKIHIVGVPRGLSTPDRPMDSWPTISYFLTTYLHRAGHEVHYYGHEESTVECTKKWVCANKGFLEKNWKYNRRKKGYGTVWDFGHNPPAEQEFERKAYEFLKENADPNEIIIFMWSSSIHNTYHWMINDKITFNLMIDGHVGHRWPCPFTKYHVYSSQCNRNMCYGKFENTQWEINWVDTVIYPMANDLTNFKYKEEKEDYFLFYGRLLGVKGIKIYVMIAREFPDKKFIVAGQGKWKRKLKDGTDLGEIPPNIEYVGVLDREKRKEYLSNAKAVISPSNITESFGLTVVEAGLSGTPVITSDSGGYCESVINGFNGFRCSYFNDFIVAINDIDKIKSKNCKKQAMKFTAEELIKDWEKYLTKVNTGNWYKVMDYETMVTPKKIILGNEKYKGQRKFGDGKGRSVL